MAFPDDDPDPDNGAAARLRHDLKTPLTTISARSQLIARWTARSRSLDDADRARTLASLAAIDDAVRQLLAVIDAMGPHGPGDPEADE